MRLIALSAATALLAACGEATPVDEVEPQPMAPLPATMVDPPEIPANSLETIDLTGSYSRLDNTLMFEEDGTYRFLGSGGEIVTGTYTPMEDGSRIRLEDFEGGPAFFSVGHDAIYRLPDEATPYNEITAEQAYRRNVTPPPTEDDTAAPPAEE